MFPVPSREQPVGRHSRGKGTELAFIPTLLNISCVPLSRHPLSTFVAAGFATCARVLVLRGAHSLCSSNGQAKLRGIKLNIFNFWLTCRLPLHGGALGSDEGESVGKYGERERERENIKGQAGLIKLQPKKSPKQQTRDG